MKKYKKCFLKDAIPIRIKKDFKTMEKLFVFLEKKNNFKVDPLKGLIILLLKKEREEEIEIKLGFVGEKEKREEDMESNSSEEWGKIENI